jgi:hypothetical protein
MLLKVIKEFRQDLYVAGTGRDLLRPHRNLQIILLFLCSDILLAQAGEAVCTASLSAH